MTAWFFLLVTSHCQNLCIFYESFLFPFSLLEVSHTFAYIFFINYFSFFRFFFLFAIFSFSAFIKRQWQTPVTGQASSQAERNRTQGFNFLTNGSHVGYSCRLPSMQALPFPGKYVMYFVKGKYLPQSLKSLQVVQCDEVEIATGFKI